MEKSEYYKDQAKKMTDTERKHREYDKANTKGLYIKLNVKTDADILEALSSVKNKQGYIKALIRQDLKKELGSELIRHFEKE